MKGYLNRPDATADTIDDEGYLHTGDVGYVNKLGFLSVIDRVKELIKYNGLQVAPAELEALLLTNDQIDDAAVIGIPEEGVGELPKGFIVRKAGSKITGPEVQEFIAKRVSPHKKLRLIEFIDIIPKSASGKILRRELRDREKQRSKL
uniref:Acyl-CoA synthetase (AMP-forming)/AMP-acid ligase II n=1 Tax=Hirondellea gigas TaxID=1518452 RepID=A0A6A7GED5_9CRUS